MKKIIIFICLSLILLTGCSNEEKTMKCTSTVEESGIKADLQYTVYYNGNNVTKVNSIEKIEAEDDNINLEDIKETFEQKYSSYTDLDYYNVNVTIEDNMLTSTIDIDYTKVDLDKMIEIDSANSALIKDGKIDIDDLKTMYESVGATCKK